MGVDYQARKGAKKNRKRINENLKPRRERKKKGARRLCRGVCYQEPSLTAEDVGGEDSQRHSKSLDATGQLGQLKRFLEEKKKEEIKSADPTAQSAKHRQAPTHSTERDVVQTRTQGMKRLRPVEGGAKLKSTGGPAQASGVAVADPGAGKRRRLSTSVSLLDARAAGGEARHKKTYQHAAQRPVHEGLQGFPELVQRFMMGEGLAEPMPVQERCWPALLEGRDVEVVAEPGAGKTLGYLLPGAERLARGGHGADSHPEAPLMLVVLPTRELAQQVAGCCRDLRQYSGLRTVCITGGADREEQVVALSSRRPHILVATPGRLLDLAEDGSLSLDAVQYVVLDEADKMLGMGFQPQIQRLKELLLPQGEAPPGAHQPGQQSRAQVSLFTATLPDSLSDIAAAWLSDPCQLRVSHSAACVSRTVTQVVQVCAEHKKPAKLGKHLAQIKEGSKGLRNPPRILVFANRIKTVRFLHKQVTEAGFRAAVLHGDRSQEERELAMHDFRSGKVQVLVATDVAARGLHIRGLPYVVNYDFPTNIEQYIHRVGRTGRLATDGHAFSFFTRELAPLASPLMDLLEAHGQAVDPNLVKLVEAYRVAAERMDLVAAATGGNELARPQTNHVLCTLGLRTKRQRKIGGRSEADNGATLRNGGGESDEGEDARGGISGCNQEAPGKEVLPYFMASKSFRGPRQGYAFKKGIKGMGYYLDTLQLELGRAKGSRSVHQPRSVHQHKQKLRERYATAPIGGADAAAVATGYCAGIKGGSKGSARSTGTRTRGMQRPGAAKNLLPGQQWRLSEESKGECVQDGSEASWHGDERITESPAELREMGMVTKRSTKKRALPGRIRKKLASQHAQQ